MLGRVLARSAARPVAALRAAGAAALLQRGAPRIPADCGAALRVPCAAAPAPAPALLRRPRAPALHGVAVRSLATGAGEGGAGAGADTLVSSVFGGDGAAGAAAAELDEDAGADRHQNRHPKSRTMKEGKKTLKPWSGGKGGAQQNQFFMEVRTEHVKILIGKRGEKVHSMMQESGAKIFISNQPGQDSSMRKMAIMGPADAVAKAKALVNAQIEYAETSAVLEQSTTVQIPVKQTGLVIGKAGATIKDIEAETGATVNIESR